MIQLWTNVTNIIGGGKREIPRESVQLIAMKLMRLKARRADLVNELCRFFRRRELRKNIEGGLGSLFVASRNLTGAKARGYEVRRGGDACFSARGPWSQISIGRLR